ncbi:F-box family protein [Striga asiatica]|uniref:F-box family protein n=1 Tax=Striga asiatica TaxID=4170 RepID=A0A5A7RKM4_STRAF|nr:F-box family protein [Striga asiatica]
MSSTGCHHLVDYLSVRPLVVSSPQLDPNPMIQESRGNKRARTRIEVSPDGNLDVGLGSVCLSRKKEADWSIMSSTESNPVYGMSGRLPSSRRLPLSAALVVSSPQLDPNPMIQESRGNKRARTRIEVSPDGNLDVGLALGFLSSINEDILLEIFLRLSNCRYAIQLSSVCWHWHTLISQPQFIPRFICLHRDLDQSYTILFRMNDLYEDCPEYCQLVATLYSKESLLLHGKHALSSSSNYLDFMGPMLMVIRASCNDLLLVSPDSRQLVGSHKPRRYYICNPVTKKWFLIPKDAPYWFLIPKDAPYGFMVGFALLCTPDSNGPYKVVLLDFLICDHETIEVPVGRYIQPVLVFCSESQQWTKSSFLVPRRAVNDYSVDLKIVVCNGTLYWMDGLYKRDRVVSLDLGNNHCSVIYFPDIVINSTSEVPNSRTHLGVVRDELRLLHVLKAGPGRKCFVVGVWELDRRDCSWALVGQRELTFSEDDDGRDALVGAAFHPKDCDSIFVVCGKSVYECAVSKDKCRKLGEIRESIGDEGLAAFVLTHSPWPSPVPCV